MIDGITTYGSTELIEKLQPYIEQKIDLIKFKLQKVNQNGEILEKIEGPIFEEANGQEAFNKMYSEDILLDSPCVYLIKKEVFKNEKFEQTYHEDFGLIPLLIVKSKTVVSTPYYLYEYVQAPNSITRNENYDKTLKKMDDSLTHYDNMIKRTKQLNLNRTTLKQLIKKILLKINIKLYLKVR